ncbi:hypothetical protein CDAR_576601 [Caerostris darwini]|uniref:Uncharacterized protein n=1 Tax=Caerostris darwini TaxID=1538125 RepID=A0AAV4TGE2_9ARAC|nr:hypothetical protein CDAR_576601 [Caerostris darwini]
MNGSCEWLDEFLIARNLVQILQMNRMTNSYCKFGMKILTFVGQNLPLPLDFKIANTVFDFVTIHLHEATLQVYRKTIPSPTDPIRCRWRPLKSEVLFFPPVSEPDRVHHHPSVMPPPHTPVACQRPDRDGKPFILHRWEMNAWLDMVRGQLLLSGR